MLSVYQFKAQATFSDGTTKDVTNEVAWSSDNKSIAEIDETGLAFAVREGQAIITATASNGLTDTTALSISDTADIRSISIRRTDSHTESTPLGFTASYKAIAKVSSLMKEYDVTDQVKWITDNEATGAFSSKTPGLYETQGCETGDTVISCVFEETDIKSKNTLNLSVTDAKVTGIKVFGVIDGNEVRNPYILSNRENIPFIAKAALSDGTSMVIEPSSDLVWTVDPADNIAADDNGVVTPEAGSQFTPQQYTAKATYNYTYQPTGKSETFEAKTFLNIADAVQVNSITLEAVEPAATAEGISLPVGHTAKFKATASVSTMNRNFDVTDQVTWSDVSAAGTMDAGLFTAETAGSSADVIATLTLSDIGGTEHTVESEAIKVTVTDAILESVAIDQNAPQIINSNNELVFTATATYSDGSTVTLDPANLPDGASIAWSSADTSIAEIDETTGAVTPKADAFGQAEITAAYTEGEVTANDATMISTYDAMSVTELTIDTVPAGVTECANGYTVQFQAIAKIGTKDTEIDVTKQVEWNNDDIAAIGSIDENGVFTATAAGSADIKATLTLVDYSDVDKTVESDSYNLTVTDAVLKSIKITSTDSATDFGDKAPQILNNNMDLVFTATGIFSDGTEQALSSADGLAWSSENTDIAAIDAETGAASPKADAWGQTKITAASGDISAHIILSTADAMAVTNITVTVDGDLTSIAKGMTAQFRAMATIGADATTYDITDKVTWDGLTDLGTIDEHGLFTAQTPGGPVDVTATYNDVSSDPYAFEVTNAVIDHIEIAPANPTILNTQTQEFTAKAIMTDGTEIDPLPASSLVWSSSDETVCEINNEGMAIPVPYQWGQVIITASCTDPDTGDTFDGKNHAYRCDSRLFRPGLHDCRLCARHFC